MTSTMIYRTERNAEAHSYELHDGTSSNLQPDGHDRIYGRDLLSGFQLVSLPSTVLDRALRLSQELNIPTERMSARVMCHKAKAGPQGLQPPKMSRDDRCQMAQLKGAQQAPRPRPR